METKQYQIIKKVLVLLPFYLFTFLPLKHQRVDDAKLRLAGKKEALPPAQTADDRDSGRFSGMVQGFRRDSLRISRSSWFQRLMRLKAERL